VHELGITQGIIDRAREAALKAGASRVSDLFITITPAADFTQESIEMYFAMLAGEDELFKEAALHFASAAVPATCLNCGDDFSTDAPQPLCPMCGSNQVRFDPAAPMVQLTDIGIDEGRE
jgi:hydrogenase nickel incorporation protein HypA/HybF